MLGTDEFGYELPGCLELDDGTFLGDPIPASRKLHAEVPPSKHARGRLPKKSRRERHADKIERRERIRAALDVKAMQ
jgi:hypothetical protein